MAAGPKKKTGGGALIVLGLIFVLRLSGVLPELGAPAESDVAAPAEAPAASAHRRDSGAAAIVSAFERRASGSWVEAEGTVEATLRDDLEGSRHQRFIVRLVNDHTVLDLLDHFRGTGHIVRLIEYMDVGNRNGWRMDQVVPSRELLEQVQARWPLRRVDRNYPGEVALRYEYADGQGEIGFISSVTEPFCGSCSRARLSSDGMLYTCLFANRGTDLREPLRNNADDDELADILSRIWLQRADRYSELRRPDVAEHHALSKVEMYRIGG